jgi:hypothetical protein
MSHTTTIKALAIKDEGAIRRAVDELKRNGTNVSLLQNAKPRMYYPRQEVMCDLVLKLHDGQYDVGFQKQADGTFALIMDEWGGHVSGQVGASCPVPQNSEDRALWAIGSFAQQYGRFAAINAATAQGYIIERDYFDEHGNVQLEVRVS